MLTDNITGTGQDDFGVVAHDQATAATHFHHNHTLPGVAFLVRLTRSQAQGYLTFTSNGVAGSAVRFCGHECHPAP